MAAPENYDAPRPDEPLIGLQFLPFGNEGLDELQRRARHLLSRSLNTGSLVAAVGSGVSKNYGHPTWKELERAVGVALYGERGYNGDFQSGAFTQSDVLMGRFEKYQAKWNEERHLQNDFRTFGEYALSVVEPGEALGPDPLTAIIESLRIRRFVTSNFDDTIEGRLAKSGVTDFLSLTANSSPADLLCFALGAPGYRSGVFHIHGRRRLDPADRDLDIVLSESDYKRVYVGGDSRYKGFRDALSLLFFSNPILFMGMGLSEPDLLRPLRQFAAEQQRDLRERPFFALMPFPADREQAEEEWRLFYLRYGIKTRYYGDGTKPQHLGSQLEDRIREVSADRVTWWSNWQRKPFARVPSFYIGRLNTPKPPSTTYMIRHRTMAPRLFEEADARRICQHFQLEPAEDSDTYGRAVLAVGRAGMGKGGLAQEIATTTQPYAKWTKRFAASLHFANDLLSIIDAAARYLGSDLDTPHSGAPSVLSQEPVQVRSAGDAIARLESSLKVKGHLCMIGGLERLLVPFRADQERHTYKHAGSDEEEVGPTALAQRSERYPIPVGREATLECRRLCEMLVRLVVTGELGTDVLLTSAVIPSTFADILLWHDRDGLLVPQRGRIVVEHLSKPRPDDKSELETQLHEALRGHLYLIWLVQSNMPNVSGDRWLRALLARLTAVDFQHRGSVVVDYVLHATDFKWQGPERLSGSRPAASGAVLELLSLCSAPLTADNVADALGPTFRDAQDAVTFLHQQGLLLEIVAAHEPRYTTHSSVRGHFISQQNNLDPPSEVHRFDLAGLTANVPDTLGQPPDLAAPVRIAPFQESDRTPLDRILRNAENLDDPNASALAARAAFSMLRGRWTATAIGRPPHSTEPSGLTVEHSDLDWYLQALVRLLNVLRRLATENGLVGWRSETQPRSEVERIREGGGVLYADELAWVYNELALASACRGALYDAYALYRLSQDINILAEGNEPGQRWCESVIGLALVAIERGQLSRAQNHLDSAFASANRHGDDELVARIEGHIGVVRHLVGDLAGAQRLYLHALTLLDGGDNRRARSTFQRHLADLCRARGSLDEADDYIRLSIATATSGRHYDLVQYGLVSDVTLRLERLRREPGSRLAMFDLPRHLVYIRKYARRVGMPRLEFDATRVHVRLALEQGDVDEAGQLALRCLGLSSIHGMALRQTAALVLMGEVFVARGERDGARQLLRCAASQAERQMYQSQFERAQRCILNQTETTL